MIKLISNFPYLMLILIVGFLLVRLLYYFIKRGTRPSELDKAFWQLKFVSICFAVLMFVSVLYLPSGYYGHIDQTRSSADQALHQLVQNEETIGEDIRQIHNVLYFILLITAGYFVAIAIFIGKVQKERQRDGGNGDPKSKKPLGL